jgi:outer membrane protein assembly factor BamB
MRTSWLAVFAVPLAALAATAADWPQWRGPARDAVSAETGLLKEWPKDGPKLLWKAADVGNGYSTPSVAKGRVYLLGDKGDDEFALALDAKDGKELWKVPLGKVGKNFGPQYPGVRSTPTVDGDVLYCLGSDGDLVCLETDQGKERWRKSLKKDFDGKPGQWAYAESPLVDGDMLVCTPGGKTTLVALNKKTGDVVWKAEVPGGDAASFSSAVVAEAGGVKQYVQFVAKGLVGIDAKTGKFLWRYDKTIDPQANIPTPVVHDAYVFSTTGRNGCGLVKLKADKDAVTAEEVYYNKDLPNHIGGVVRVGDYVYGTNNAGNNAKLVCMEFATGKVKWQDNAVGKGAVCYADGMLYVRGEKGEVALAVATPDGYMEKGRFTQPEKTNRPAWPHPVVANGCLLLRDQGHLWCYDVKDPKGGK